jgi:hypothetical protein
MPVICTDLVLFWPPSVRLTSSTNSRCGTIRSSVVPSKQIELLVVSR